MSHVAKVKSHLNDCEAVLKAGDRAAAMEACVEAQGEAVAVFKAKSAAHPKAATATSTAADAEVVAACDACTAACAAPGMPPAGATPVAAIPWSDLWDLFIANAPSIFAWIKKIITG